MVMTGSFLVVTARSLSRDFIDELLASMLLTIAANISTFPNANLGDNEFLLGPDPESTCPDAPIFTILRISCVCTDGKRGAQARPYCGI
jgi:hypothetical protein